jgi:hypothetical protein
LIDEKVSLGDGDAVTVIGNDHKGRLVVLTKRVSKKTLTAHAPSKHACVAKSSIIKRLTSEKDPHRVTFRAMSYLENLASYFLLRDQQLQVAFLPALEQLGFQQGQELNSHRVTQALCAIKKNTLANPGLDPI